MKKQSSIPLIVSLFCFLSLWMLSSFMPKKSIFLALAEADIPRDSVFWGVGMICCFCFISRQRFLRPQKGFIDLCAHRRGSSISAPTEGVHRSLRPQKGFIDLCAHRRGSSISALSAPLRNQCKQLCGRHSTNLSVRNVTDGERLCVSPSHHYYFRHVIFSNQSDSVTFCITQSNVSICCHGE